MIKGLLSAALVGFLASVSVSAFADAPTCPAPSVVQGYTMKSVGAMGGSSGYYVVQSDDHAANIVEVYMQASSKESAMVKATAMLQALTGFCATEAFRGNVGYYCEYKPFSCAPLSGPAAHSMVIYAIAMDQGQKAASLLK